MAKKICALTMVRNDNFFLKKWVEYYTAQIGASNLYVYFDGNDQVVSRYKITLTGTVSAGNREITAVSFDCEFGDVCETIQQIDGDMVGIIITHPTEGYLMRVFVLDENGVFSEC